MSPEQEYGRVRRIGGVIDLFNEAKKRHLSGICREDPSRRAKRPIEMFFLVRQCAISIAHTGNTLKPYINISFTRYAEPS